MSQRLPHLQPKAPQCRSSEASGPGLSCERKLAMSRTFITSIGCISSMIVACASHDASEEPGAGQVSLSVTSAPSDVLCLVIQATGSGRTVTRQISVTPGQTISTPVSGLPTGSVSVGATAYPSACSAVTATSIPNWLSDPVTQTISLTKGTSVALNLVLRPSASVVPSIDWQDDNAGGSGGVGGSSSTGGVGTGGAATGGAATGGTSTTCSVGTDVITNFESSKGDMIPQSGRTGYWYVYFPGSGSTPPSGTSQTPALVNGGPIAAATDPNGGTCDAYALHTTGSGFATSPNTYAGVGAYFVPHTYPDMAADAYDARPYTGISFKIRSGSGTLPALWVEVLAKENQPSSTGGTATNTSVDLYNTRGQMLYTPWTTNTISTSYQTITVPFATLVPRWVPSAANCPTPGTGVPKCQAPAFVPQDVLGLQFSFYRDSGFPTPTGSVAGTYDLWIDDVTFIRDDAGLQTRSGFPLTNAGSMGSCQLPTATNANAKYLVSAYNQWKSKFVSGSKVIRPENGNDTTSAAIAAGMLISVNMNDKVLFDSLYGTWKTNVTAGSLMNWCLPAGSGSCSATGGSDTGADEDAAFALLQADKVFGGGTYKTDALKMIADIYTRDIDGTSKLPKGGSNYASTSGSVTSPAHFAPAYYSAFKTAGDSNDWQSVINAVYTVINGSLAGSNGLLPAWCSNNCTAAASNGTATDVYYQYDSHRIPMRIGLDYCFNARTTAKAYVSKTTAFFANSANAGLNGTGRIFDVYQLTGTAASGSSPRSASAIGGAAIGAMADGTNSAFVNDGYQAVFDILTRGTLEPNDANGNTIYSYKNATSGMITLLIMTGNFSH